MQQSYPRIRCIITEVLSLTPLATIELLKVSLDGIFIFIFTLFYYLHQLFKQKSLMY